MKIKEYFKNLSKTYSGNYLAMIGCIIFAFPFLGAISRFMQGIIFRNSSIIKAIPISFFGETCFYLPITCVLAVIPIIVLFKFLLKPIYSLKAQILFILLSILLCICVNLFAPDYTYQGAGIYFPFVLALGFPIPMIAAIIFFILFYLDLTKHLDIKNKELTTNKYYIKLVNIFYYYVLLIIPIVFFIVAYYIALY